MVAIAFKNESYEVILKNIWGPVIILSFQFKFFECIEIVGNYWRETFQGI